MKLRHRLSITFAVLTAAMLVLARLVTIVSFRELQVRELDESLASRAKEEAKEAALIGRGALEEEYEAEGKDDPLDELVTYGALYRGDGTLVADTNSFAHAPSLRELGVSPDVKLPRCCFDFPFRGTVLRGYLAEVGRNTSNRQILLLAASRKGMDTDARKLLTIGNWVHALAAVAAMLIGLWLGQRMTRGVEAVARAANKVKDGALDVQVGPEVGHDEEVNALASTLRGMVDKLRSLIESERRFAANAAHELRSPLAALRMQLELALRRPRSPAEYEETLRSVLEDAERLIGLAEDLLVVARLGGHLSDDTGKAPVAIAPLVADAIAASHARAEAIAPIVTDLPAVYVLGRERELMRMLRNLIDNAVKHSPPNSSVRILGRCISITERMFIEVAVEDEGPGVPAHLRDRIFEPFFRADDERATSGAGLGLGIAREIARRHGGDISLDTNAPRTRFVVRLPVARTADDASVPASSPDRNAF